MFEVFSFFQFFTTIFSPQMFCYCQYRFLVQRSQKAFCSTPSGVKYFMSIMSSSFHLKASSCFSFRGVHPSDNLDSDALDRLGLVRCPSCRGIYLILTSHIPG